MTYKRIMTRLVSAAAGALLACVAPYCVVSAEPVAQIDTRGWDTASATGGSIAWSVFAAARQEVVIDKGNPIFVFTLTDAIKNLDGQTIRINGYMMPLEPANRQTHFLLLAYPMSCPFHSSVGGSQIVEIKASTEVAFSYAPVLIEGLFHLVDPSSSGLPFVLDGAHAVDAKD